MPVEIKSTQPTLSAFQVFFKANQEKLSKKFRDPHKSVVTKKAQDIWHDMRSE